MIREAKRQQRTAPTEILAPRQQEEQKSAAEGSMTAGATSAKVSVTPGGNRQAQRGDNLIMMTAGGQQLQHPEGVSPLWGQQQAS